MEIMEIHAENTILVCRKIFEDEKGEIPRYEQTHNRLHYSYDGGMSSNTHRC